MMSPAPLRNSDDTAEEGRTVGEYGSLVHVSANDLGDRGTVVDAGISDFSFTSYRKRRVLADASRLAGRRNAASVSEKELENLLRERSELLDAKFGAGLTPERERRLRYVNWSIDRIEDAVYGPEMDALEHQAELVHGLMRDIQNLQRQIDDLSGKKRERRRS